MKTMLGTTPSDASYDKVGEWYGLVPRASWRSLLEKGGLFDVVGRMVKVPGKRKPVEQRGCRYELFAQDWWTSTVKAAKALFGCLTALGAQVSDKWAATIQRFVATHAYLSCAGKQTAWLKFHWCCYTARLLSAPGDFSCERELPSNPDFADECPGMFLSGVGYAYLNRLLRVSRKARSAVELEQVYTYAFSLNESKDIFPAPTQLEVERSLAKSFKALTGPQEALCKRRDLDPFGWLTKGVVKWELTQEALEALYLRCCRRVGQIIGSKAKLDVSLPLPSLSGHFETRVVDGGAAMIIADQYHGYYDRYGVHECHGCDDLGWRLASKCCHVNPKAARPTSQSLDQGMDDYRCTCHFKSAVWAVRKLMAYEEQRNLCQLVGLPEPLKVRTISKGQPNRYWRLKYLQKVLWRTINEFPQFRLTSGPISSEHYASLGHLRSGEGWVSGDYEAATDNLRSESSTWAAVGFTEGVGWMEDWTWGLERESEELKSLLDGLCRYQIQNPEREDDFQPQTRGQLMGSPISFPILCICNYATLLCSQIVEGKLSYEDLWDDTKTRCVLGESVLINGDDILFRADQSLYQTWRHVATTAGLRPSAGKNYYSRRFAIVNSCPMLMEQHTLVINNRAFPVLEPRRIPFTTFGSIWSNATRGKGAGEMQAMGGTACGGDEELSFIGAQARQMWSNAPERLRDDLMSIFISHRREVLDRAPMGCSWFLPEALGGLGLPCRDPLSRISNREFVAALEMFQNDDPCPRSTNPARGWMWGMESTNDLVFIDENHDLEEGEPVYRGIESPQSTWDHLHLVGNFADQVNDKWRAHIESYRRAAKSDNLARIARSQVEQLFKANWTVVTLSKEERPITKMTCLPVVVNLFDAGIARAYKHDFLRSCGAVLRQYLGEDNWPMSLVESWWSDHHEGIRYGQPPTSLYRQQHVGNATVVEEDKDGRIQVTHSFFGGC